MKMITFLQNLGLTDGEAKTYMALLKLGPSTVGPLVKATGVAYPNMYDVLRRLGDKGLVSTIHKGKVRRFQATTPRQLNAFLDRKEQAVQEQRAMLTKALPELESLREGSTAPEAAVYTGFRGLRAAYEDMLRDNSGGELIAIYEHEPRFAELSDNFNLENLDLWKGIQTRCVVNEEYRSSPVLKSDLVIKARFVSFPLFSHVESYGNKLLLVSWEEPIVTTLITANGISTKFKAHFEELWRVAKE